jgi:hypothetical protein
MVLPKNGFSVIYNFHKKIEFRSQLKPAFYYLANNNIVTCRRKARMVEPEQTSFAEQRLVNEVPVTTSSNERVVAR